MALNYLDLLVASGAPSEAQVPYKADCGYIEGIDVNLSHYPGVGKFMIGSYYALPNFMNGKATYLQMFKDYLKIGHPIAFSGLVPQTYDFPGMEMVNGAYDPKLWLPSSGHGQVIVGFDDSLGHTGAFLVQNSFGTDWPYLPNPNATTAGRLYWTYEAFFASQNLGAVAYPIVQHVTIPNRSVVFQGVQMGDPQALVQEVAQTVDPVTSEHVLVLQHSFSTAVKLLSVTVKPPSGTPITTKYNATISQGHIGVAQRTAFAPGSYVVTLQAETLGVNGARGRSLTYNATVQVH
jgi:hypothetical protein